MKKLIQWLILAGLWQAEPVYGDGISVDTSVNSSSPNTFTGAQTFNGNISSTGTLTITGTGGNALTGALTVVAGSATVNGNMLSTGTITASGSGGVSVTGGPFTPYSRTEAQLKASTPTAVGQMFYDSTNVQFVLTTGTATSFDYGEVNDGTAAPTGW